jgi:hypothetical protein
MPAAFDEDDPMQIVDQFKDDLECARVVLRVGREWQKASEVNGRRSLEADQVYNVLWKLIAFYEINKLKYKYSSEYERVEIFLEQKPEVREPLGQFWRVAGSCPYQGMLEDRLYRPIHGLSEEDWAWLDHLEESIKSLERALSGGGDEGQEVWAAPKDALETLGLDKYLTLAEVSKAKGKGKIRTRKPVDNPRARYDEVEVGSLARLVYLKLKRKAGKPKRESGMQ